MSSLPSAPAPAPLPTAWTDRLFARFVAIFGSQKTQAMWAGADMADVKGLWGDQLGRYQPASIAAAIQRLVDRGSEWPPTLPEFSDLCRQCAIERTGGAPALPEPRRPRPPGMQLPNLSAGRPGVDHLRWARKVGSITAARHLIDFACRDSRGRAILEELVRNDFAGIPPESAKFLRQWHAAHPDWRSKCGELAPEDRAA